MTKTESFILIYTYFDPFTRGEPHEDAEGGRGDRGGTGTGARGVVYTNVKSNIRPRLNGQ